MASAKKSTSAKAPVRQTLAQGRKPRGEQGYGMSTGKGKQRVDVTVKTGRNNQKIVSGKVKIYPTGSGGKANEMMAAAGNSYAAKTKGQNIGLSYNNPTTWRDNGKEINLQAVGKPTKYGASNSKKKTTKK